MLQLLHNVGTRTVVGKLINIFINQNKTILAFTAAVSLWLLLSIPTHATSINVAAVTDGYNSDGICQLSEAVVNVNNQTATHSDCPAGNGINDTVNIAAGTIKLVGNVPRITKPLNILGAGMKQTIIDGDLGQYEVFAIDHNDVADQITVKGFTIIGFSEYALELNSISLDLQEVEIDGTNSGLNPNFAFRYINYTSDTASVVAKNIYIHDINVSRQVFHTFVVSGSAAGGVINADISNITISSISNAGGVNNLIFSNGAYDGLGGNHIINATVNNATINNISSTSQSGMIVAVNLANSGPNGVNVTVNNSTFVNTDSANVEGLLAVGVGVDPGSNAQVSITAKNVLISHTALNCNTVDYGSAFGGQGAIDLSINSTGGNISDDASCNSYFSETSDQNNVIGLFSSLGTLTDNGGFVPTIALLANSPAINAGVIAPGLMSDARGYARPFGGAYDAGSYEFAFGSSNSPEASAQLPNSGSLANTGENIRTIVIFAGIIALGSCLAIFTLLKKSKKRYTRD